ncbi:M23 family metallopeptidase [Microbacterium sp. H1-D42]|uniref:M23 family metallopeptidase n=1 Tax=Microbacterium sp. H1-D42 TaxID=2925844 RepID=UPI001F533B66|nr:M23 family metallopeptidase [Microbacterium sp. H1-D42]UNK70848.1 M23 family metallopeptidase [Microbacterium sp. H1-D42]
MKRLALAAYRIRGLLYLPAVIVLVAIALTSGISFGDGVRQLRSLVALCAIVVFAITLVLALVGPRLLPTLDAKTVTSPVRGRWQALNSPASNVPSHGIRMYGQTYAIDLIADPLDRPRPVFGEGSAMRHPNDYPAFGEPVFAMIDGVVVRASGWRRDHRSRSTLLAVLYLMVEGAVRELGGPGFILGNHVIIRAADGTHAAIAHLQRHSVSVRVGETVAAGQQIGRCGNSGNSSEPHVHAQLMDRRSLLTAQGIPMAFADIVIDDSPERIDGLPKNGEHLTVAVRDSRVR